MRVNLTNEQAVEILRRKARRGAAWLDRELPGWHKGIDRSVLNVGSCTNCVLGQMFEDYENALEPLHVSTTWLKRHGFNATHLHSETWFGFFQEYTDRSAYQELTKAWLDEIDVRLEGPIAVTQETLELEGVLS